MFENESKFIVFYRQRFFRAKGRQKIPSTGIFTPKKSISPSQGKIPVTGISISPPHGKIPQHREIFLKVTNLFTTVEKSIPVQYSHTGKSEKFKVFSHHSTAPTHRGTLKKNQSPHNTAQGSHTGELGKVWKYPHHSTGPSHRGTLKIFKVSTHSGKSRKKSKSPVQGIFREKPISPPPAPFRAP